MDPLLSEFRGKKPGTSPSLLRCKHRPHRHRVRYPGLKNLAHKVAGWLFYVTVAVTIATFIIWLLISDLPTTTRFAVTVLVIACPHTLGLAIPLEIARSTSLGAKRGLLVKNRGELELATKADVRVVDKIGTLTTGDFKGLDVTALKEDEPKEAVTPLLYGIESGSSHPIA